MNLITTLILAVLAQQTPTASIEGVVVQIGTAQPVANAIVELSGDGARSPFVMATGADGKFEFRNLAAGRYNVKVMGNGYLENPHGRRISVTAGQAIKDVRFVMVPLGAISGRVYDATGEPVVNVSVRALKYAYADGKRTLTAVKTVTTDDRGEFRLFWLPPGQYYVGAVPAGLGESFANMHMVIGGTPIRLDADGIPQSGAGYPMDKLGERYVPVYFPGTTDPEAASPVIVQPGTDFNGVHFTLPRTTPRKVRAIAIDAAIGQPARMASVTMVPRGTSSIAASLARPASDGAVEFDSVFPGNYYAVATARIPAGGGAVRIVGGRTAESSDLLRTRQSSSFPMHHFASVPTSIKTQPPTNPDAFVCRTSRRGIIGLSPGKRLKFGRGWIRTLSRAMKQRAGAFRLPTVAARTSN